MATSSSACSARRTMRCTTRSQRVLLCRVFLVGIALVSVYFVGKSLTGIIISDSWQRTKNRFEENGVLIPIGVELSDTQDGNIGHAQEQSERQRLHMEGRQKQAKRFCENRVTKEGESDEQYSRKSCPLVSLNHPSIFCSIAKVGSTFWSRFYKVLDRNVSTLVDSPFTVPVKVADAERCQSAHKLGSLTQTRRHIVKSTFVRDPFSRLFSAYVDKLLAPNPTFWTTWGIPAMLLEVGLDTKDVTCGHGVTFKQFVRLVNNRLHREDPHVISSVRMCDPCKMNYDVIGKMETFSEDFRYLTSVLNVTFDSRLSLAAESKVDAILDSVESPFEWRQSITKCVSTQEMGRRIWRKLQIRGIISTFHEYPFADEDLSTISSTVFSKAALEAAMKSTDKEQLVLQKRQAFMEAYRTVSMGDIQLFYKLFREDFEAFGYEKRPVAVFDRNPSFVDTHAFDVNRPWATS